MVRWLKWTWSRPKEVPNEVPNNDQYRINQSQIEINAAQIRTNNAQLRINEAVDKRLRELEKKVERE